MVIAPTNPLFFRPLVMARSQPSLNMYADISKFGFASRLAKKRIYVDKTRLHLPNTGHEVLDFKKPWDSTAKPMKLKVQKLSKQATVTRQPTPVHDYINFK